jgi:hypothetical protein
MRATMSNLSPSCDCAFALERRPVPNMTACRRVPTEGDDDGSEAGIPPNAKFKRGHYSGVDTAALVTVL